jgi:hypothetical protein
MADSTMETGAGQPDAAGAEGGTVNPPFVVVYDGLLGCRHFDTQVGALHFAGSRQGAQVWRRAGNGLAMEYRTFEEWLAANYEVMGVM